MKAGLRKNILCLAAAALAILAAGCRDQLDCREVDHDYNACISCANENGDSCMQDAEDFKPICESLCHDSSPDPVSYLQCSAGCQTSKQTMEENCGSTYDYTISACQGFPPPPTA